MKKGEWTILDISKLKKEYPYKATETLAKEMGRSIRSLHVKASKMGLKKAKMGIEWTPRMLKMLTSYFPTMFNYDLAKLIGVSTRTLTRKARELNLSKADDFFVVKRKEIGRRAGAALKRTDNPGWFKKGDTTGAAYVFKKGHKESEETKKKRIESLKATYKRKRLLKSLGL